VQKLPLVECGETDIGLCLPAEIVLMPRRKSRPIVRVVFACTGCNAPFEAIQIHRPAKGAFACGLCGDEVYLWSDRYDYTDWRSVRRPRNREAWSWETYPAGDDDYSLSRSTK
jgi:peptide methionine sulfoxide reductase MsrB